MSTLSGACVLCVLVPHLMRVSWVRMVEIKMAEPSSAFVSGDVEQGKFSPFPLIPAHQDGRLSPDRRSFD